MNALKCKTLGELQGSPLLMLKCIYLACPYTVLCRMLLLHIQCLVHGGLSTFGPNFLMILITNFLLYLFYYATTKCVYGERPSFRPLGFFILSLVFWGVGVYGYLLVGRMTSSC